MLWAGLPYSKQIDNNMFGVRVIRFTKSAFERQILESVLIQEENKKNEVLNSKSEYNRCALPRLTSKLGEHTYGEDAKAAKEERRKEEEMEERIRKLRKEVNVKRRKKENEEVMDPIEERRLSKKRKTDDNLKSAPETTDQEDLWNTKTSPDANSEPDKMDHNDTNETVGEDTDQIDLFIEAKTADDTDQIDHRKDVTDLSIRGYTYTT